MTNAEYQTVIDRCDGQLIQWREELSFIEQLAADLAADIEETKQRREALNAARMTQNRSQARKKTA